MKKIGITTFHRAQNFGAMLQAIAMQEYLNKNNYDVKFIDYRCKNIEEIYEPNYINKKNCKTIIQSFIKGIFLHNIKVKRYNTFCNFMSDFYHQTNSCTNIKEVEEESKDFDFIITGSDQVWNYKLTKGLNDVYALNFRTNAKKISYAASIGLASIPKEKEEEYANKLKSVDYISIREPNCQQQLINILNRDVEVVLDPTLLLYKEDWVNCLKLNKNQEKYILVFFVDKKNEYVEYVNRLSELTGLPVIHFEKNNKYKNVLKNAYISNPKDFVEYIYNAEYIITNSFHGTAFSINLNKNFLTVPNMATSSRIINILKMVGLENKAIYKLEDIDDEVIKSIDYSEINSKLEKERQKSKDWLSKALNS